MITHDVSQMLSLILRFRLSLRIRLFEQTYFCAKDRFHFEIVVTVL